MREVAGLLKGNEHRTNFEGALRILSIKYDEDLMNRDMKSGDEDGGDDARSNVVNDSSIYEVFGKMEVQTMRNLHGDRRRRCTDENGD